MARNIGTRSNVVGSEVSALRSNVMPLTTKKSGITKPKLMASSLDCTTGASSPVMKSRTTTPAANAPRRMSSPSSDATHTSRITTRTEIRTGSWELELRCLLNSATTRGGVGRAASRTAITASTTNRASNAAVCTGLSLVSSSAIATIGPNSPTEPMASTKAPKRVSVTPASLSIGSSVPNAVVVIARPMMSVERAKPSVTSRYASTKPTASDIDHPRTARFSGLPRMRLRSMS